MAAAVAKSGDPERDLGALLRAGIVRELRRFPELECTFRHGLLQDAALSTLTSASLRELYSSVGREMEARFAERADEHAEDLAFYFYRSEEPEQALAYLERAAARSTDAAHVLELLERARKVAARVGDAGAAARIDARARELGVPGAAPGSG